ncbi:MAG: peptidylprolyl isomerase [Nostoc sp. DedSLP03]|uniref:peptidylprolyl isomerase n=1 Tax=Nostoc sp. DedSLP03 TaxID=3075400 RepID=UPI002AD1E9FC|nr:peptidylprolyl isomerase [Nostoc sp. DedSLP03]MDZ7966081.1 peptidylprolyl isomerase [Nostoc sp. DedSLP03]
MSQTITITKEDILEQVKLSFKIPDLIEEIIIRKVIEDAAAEVDIKVEAEELQKVADELRLAKQLNNADDTWAWLKKYSLSLDNFEKILYTILLANKLSQHLFSNKVEPYFFEHQLDYMGVIMYEIVLDDEDLAIELFYTIKEGEVSFYDVVHKYVPDTELRRHGGYRGIVRRKDLKPEISAAVFTAKPPQLLKPIITSKGFHLILVEELIQPKLDDKLYYQILSKFFDEWKKQQIEQIEVVKTL